MFTIDNASCMIEHRVGSMGCKPASQADPASRSPMRALPGSARHRGKIMPDDKPVPPLSLHLKEDFERIIANNPQIKAAVERIIANKPQKPDISELLKS